MTGSQQGWRGYAAGIALHEIIRRCWTLGNVYCEVRVWCITSYEVEALRGMSDVEIMEFAGECDDARLDCVFPYHETDFGEEEGEECECRRHGHGVLL